MCYFPWAVRGLGCVNGNIPDEGFFYRNTTVPSTAGSAVVKKPARFIYHHAGCHRISAITSVCKKHRVREESAFDLFRCALEKCHTSPYIFRYEFSFVVGGNSTSNTHKTLSHEAHPPGYCAKCYLRGKAAPPPISIFYHHHFASLLAPRQRHGVHICGRPSAGDFDVVLAGRG